MDPPPTLHDIDRLSGHWEGEHGRRSTDIRDNLDTGRTQEAQENADTGRTCDGQENTNSRRNQDAHEGLQMPVSNPDGISPTRRRLSTSDELYGSKTKPHNPETPPLRRSISRRKYSTGTDEELTELAAPEPVDRHLQRKNTLEQEQRSSSDLKRTRSELARLQSPQSRRSPSRRKYSFGTDEELTELAVPEPIDRQLQRRNTLETEQRRRRSISGPRLSGVGNEGFLSELSVPPIAEGDKQELSPEDEVAVASPASSVQSGEKDTAAAERSRLLTDLYTVSQLILFSILGTLARLGLDALALYPSAPFTSPVLWANVAGSIIMGFLAQDRRLFRNQWGDTTSKSWSFARPSTVSGPRNFEERSLAAHGKVKKTIPLYIGLTTGFCGSLTSFSSFIRDLFLALSNSLPYPSATHPWATTPPQPRSPGFSFLAVLGILIVQITATISGFHFGAHIALATDLLIPVLPFKFIRHYLNPLLVFLAVGCWLGALFLTLFPPNLTWRGRVTFAILFAPPGCLLRFYASRSLNARIPSFPLGTFFVNIFGTLILGMCWDLQHSTASRGSLVGCQVLEGVMEGFCGCTTTVSTWVAELGGLGRKNAYVYGAASVGIALAGLVVVMGSLLWTQGFGKTACGP